MIPKHFTGYHRYIVDYLMEEVASKLFGRRELSVFDRWLQQLPHHLVMTPALMLIHTWSDLLSCKYDNIAAHQQRMSEALVVIIIPTSVTYCILRTI